MLGLGTAAQTVASTLMFGVTFLLPTLRRTDGLSLAEAGLDELVDAVHGELFAAEKATALLAEGATVYVGDHPGDMAAAEAAGAYALGVATGANDEAALKAAGADEVLASLEDFPGWLSGHLSRH